MSQIKIFHNPRCTKSRLTLQLLKDKGIDPEVVLYLENPPSKDDVNSILDILGVEPRDIMRKQEAEYKDNNLGDASLSKDDLVNAIVTNPKVLERPIVVNNGKAAIGRPPENILEII